MIRYEFSRDAGIKSTIEAVHPKWKKITLEEFVIGVGMLPGMYEAELTQLHLIQELKPDNAWMDYHTAKGIYRMKIVEDRPTVDIVAASYEWTCPRCDDKNLEFEITEIVFCGNCNYECETNPAEHARG